MTATIESCSSIKPARTPLQIGDPALAATLELVYLRPFFDKLPPHRRSAIDIGAHRGEVTAELLSMGFKVLAVEPQQWLADRLQQRFGAEMSDGRFALERCAASNRRGTAILHVGSASTISSLEEEWTTVAFPEYFKTPTKVEVPLVPAAALMHRHQICQASFAKIDVEGHELPALRGLLDSAIAIDPPAAIMFEASHAFPEQAEACLKFLADNGYTKFDLFVRWGVDPVAAERSNIAELPAAWRQCEGRNFYANFIAYHAGAADDAEGCDPVAFIRQYQVLRSIELLQSLPPTFSRLGGPNQALREEILAGDWQAFPQHRISRHFTLEPTPADTEATAADAIVEFGGGCGASALQTVLARPKQAYTIVDLAERLVVQHFHLTLSAPQMVVRVATSLHDRAAPGEILLVPAHLASSGLLQGATAITGEGFDDLPADLREMVRGAGSACGAD